MSIPNEIRTSMMQEHANAAIAEVERKRADGTLWKPSQEFWDLDSPTFIENWPEDLHAISIPSIILRLDQADAQTLGSYIAELGEGFNAPENHQSRRELMISRMDIAIKQFPNGAFVRLGSRSPKDAMYWGVGPDEDSFRVTTGEQAWRLLTACSERIHDDLQMQIAMNHDPRIVVRQWLDLPEWSEFRCFQKDGQLTGISQYYNHEVFPEVVNRAAGFKWAIEQFHKSLFKSASHLESVVFDVFVKVRDIPTEASFVQDGSIDVAWRRNYEVKLLEINPYSPSTTDPCLFSWHMPMFNGQLRYRTKLGPRETCIEED